MEKTKVLSLEEGEDFQTSHFRLQKNDHLRFIVGSSLQPLHVDVFTNHPSGKQNYDREKFCKLQWVYPFNCKADDGDRYASIKVTWPGTFAFHVVKNGKEKVCQGYFIVEPELITGSGSLPLDSVVLQTYLSKSLGHFDEWEERLLVAKECGYNFIHFTPIQELGESQSSYSIENQLKINSAFIGKRAKLTFDDIQGLVQKMQNEWSVLSLVDVVWNHTANTTKWLNDHPEAAYNLQNSPHLRPAFLLDRALWHLNEEIASGQWEHIGLPSYITDPYHLERIAHIFWTHIVPSIKLHEFYMVDVEQQCAEFRNRISSVPDDMIDNVNHSHIQIIQDPFFRRYKCYIDIDKAVKVFFKKGGGVEDSIREFKEYLYKLNEEKKHQITVHNEAIIYNVIAGIRYHFLADHGPKYRDVCVKTPIMTRYFLRSGENSTLKSDENLMNSEECKFILAHQGWVMNGDALKDFAAPDSNVYLRRELIAWGDSVKLRYGNKKEDCPFLWEHMKAYTEQMARVFHGVRLDNCHSTPIPVAEYLLDAARKVNPNLYVVAELFTNSEAVDNTFVNRLGINSLIRERMSAHDAHDLGRHVHRYGGDPVGAFLTPAVSPLTSSMAHALFMDLTHDNRSPMEVRSVYDFLPSAALVAASSCAIGSNRGYDELVPHHISVVKETRLYRSWMDSAKILPESCISQDSGIVCAKRTLNELHKELSKKGYNQVFVDQVNHNVVSVTRHCPNTHKSVVVVAHTAFNEPSPHDVSSVQNNSKYSGVIPPLIIPGCLEEIAFEALFQLDLNGKNFEKNLTFINGLDSFKVQVKQHISAAESSICSIHDAYVSSDDHTIEVNFDNFPPGSVIVFKVSLKAKAKRAIEQLRCAVNMFTEQGFNLKTDCVPEIRPIDPIITQLTLAGLNRILYRCHEEEVDDGHGGGAYDIPDFGPLPYCGLQGFISVLSLVRASNDLGHPICENLRAGNWMPEYTAHRLKHNHLTRELGRWMESIAFYIRDIPRFLVPCYFDAILHSLYLRLIEHACSQMSGFVKNGSQFIRYLALGSVQFCGLTNSAPLPRIPVTPKDEKEAVTMAAGLPHFARGLWRCWGRDTFISLRGMLLVTGRFCAAKRLILAFGGCVRHGLIANLLNTGVNARYNCRDAVWWWLQVLQDYCKMAPEGEDILTCDVFRMYPDNDSQPQIKDAPLQPLHEIVQEILQRHIDGISFRERNAGPSLDSNMRDEGFKVTAGIDLETGLPYGGNSWNCGTWMDKVGSSHLSGNWGHPATPRDGSAVEIVGLCKSTISWLDGLYQQSKYPYEGVSIKGKMMSFAEWAEKIQSSFEGLFWIDVDPDQMTAAVDPKLVHRRGIYKDCYGGSHPFADYQLRPNFPIAMAVAPELFEPANAMHALKMVEEHLSGPLGLKTLDPRDWAYDGFYENDLDSTVFNKALGFNYHQGPEWLWVYGPFLRAKLYFSKIMCSERDFDKCIENVRSVLSRHKDEILSSPWRGLPELTNKDGTFCQHGCPTQAWSMACILEVLYDLENMLNSK